MPHDFPEELVELIEERDFIVGGESTDELAFVENGMCVACSSGLGADTIIIINHEGIQSLVCSGACHDDLMVGGYLSEQMKDLMDRVNMRRNLTEGHD